MGAEGSLTVSTGFERFFCSLAWSSDEIIDLKGCSPHPPLLPSSWERLKALTLLGVSTAGTHSPILSVLLLIRPAAPRNQRRYGTSHFLRTHSSTTLQANFLLEPHRGTWAPHGQGFLLCSRIYPKCGMLDEHFWWTNEYYLQPKPHILKRKMRN